MKTFFSEALRILFAVLLVAMPLSSQETEPTKSEQRAADLEAKLRQTLESSDEGARVLLELIDLYYEEGADTRLVPDDGSEEWQELYRQARDEPVFR